MAVDVDDTRPWDGKSHAIADKPPNGCSWPVGDDPGPGEMHRQLFCCARRAPGSSYCVDHIRAPHKKKG